MVDGNLGDAYSDRRWSLNYVHLHALLHVSTVRFAAAATNGDGMIAGNKLTRMVGAAVATLVTASLLAACGGDSADGGDVDTAGLTGEPIKLAVIGDVTSQTGTSYSGIPEVIRLAAEEVNQAGGIDGRPIVLIECDLQNLPDQSTRCARQAVDGEAAAALVQAGFGQEKFTSVFEPAEVAYMPAFALVPADLHSPVAFPMAAGVLTQIAGGYVAAQYCDDPVLVSIQTPQTDYMMELATMGFEALGKPAPRLVTAPLGATDYAPTAAEAVSGNPDCILPYMSEVLNTAFYPALRQTGWKDRSPENRLVGYQGGVYTERIFEEFPDLLDNMVAVDMSYPFDDPRWEKFNSMIESLQDKRLTNLTSSFTKGSYLNFLAFVEVAERVVASGQPVNNQTILEGFRQATDLTVGGLLDSVDTSKDGPIEEFPRMMNTKLIFEEVQDGQITMLHDGEFIDVGPDIEKVQ